MQRTMTIAIAGVLVSVCFFPAAAQNKRTIIRKLTLPREPVEISFKLKGQPLVATEASKHWREFARRNLMLMPIGLGI